MSPAGSFESVMAAIQGGAASIYFGAGNLNMRAKSSNNFSINNIKDIVQICKENNVKTYLTVNTIIYDEEVDTLKEILSAAKEFEVDAIIASDLAVIMQAYEIGVPIHLSTQLNITNYEAVKYFSKFADVIVLARELTLEKIKYICDKIKEDDLRGPAGELIQIEVFIHGALCMAVSGKCYLSLHEKNHSANRGACLQTCRRSYSVTDIETGNELEIDNKFIMSPKDLCTLPFIDKIIEAGATVLKIEGRGRSPEYVKTVTQTYHKAIELINEGKFDEENIEILTNKLRTVFNRDFWGGYYLGKTMGEWSNRYGSQATTKKIQIGKVNKYYSNIKVAAIKLESDEVNIGDQLLFIGPTTGVVEHSVESLRVNDNIVEKSIKGDEFSIQLDTKLRPNDKVFKIVPIER